MGEGIRCDQVLDAKGCNCPLPILRTKKAMAALFKDQVLKVETTDPGSKKDMAAWAKRSGNRLVKEEDVNGTFIFYIQKTA